MRRYLDTGEVTLPEETTRTPKQPSLFETIFLDRNDFEYVYQIDVVFIDRAHLKTLGYLNNVTAEFTNAFLALGSPRQLFIRVDSPEGVLSLVYLVNADTLTIVQPRAAFDTLVINYVKHKNPTAQLTRLTRSDVNALSTLLLKTLDVAGYNDG